MACPLSPELSKLPQRHVRPASRSFNKHHTGRQLCRIPDSCVDARAEPPQSPLSPTHRLLLHMCSSQPFMSAWDSADNSYIACDPARKGSLITHIASLPKPLQVASITTSCHHNPTLPLHYLARWRCDKTAAPAPGMQRWALGVHLGLLVRGVLVSRKAIQYDGLHAGAAHAGLSCGSDPRGVALEIRRAKLGGQLTRLRAGRCAPPIRTLLHGKEGERGGGIATFCMWHTSRRRVI